MVKPLVRAKRHGLKLSPLARRLAVTEIKDKQTFIDPEAAIQAYY
jgi:hypothetical protein